MQEKIFIIGHTAPDLDSVASAIIYGGLKNRLENTDQYIPAVAGELNKETIFSLEKFGFDQPEKIIDISGKNIILVDHNETSQAANGLAEANILEVVDHHKIDFKISQPINFEVKPWGATCSIIAEKIMQAGIALDKKTAGLLLSGILVDTVITKSPTCTEIDKDIIAKLSILAEEEDWQKYGLELFKVRSQVKEQSDAEIIKSDFKDFNFKQGKVGIGQVETVSLEEFDGRDEGLLKEIKAFKEGGNYHSVILFITDIIKEGSKFFVVTDDEEKFQEAMGARLEEGRVYIAGIISRKKQVAPKFTEVLDK